MKKLLSTLAAVAVVLFVFNLYAADQQQSQSWTGWISDSSCAAKGTSAAHKDCAIKCVKEKGASWVFVNSADKKVLPIHNQDAINQDTDLGTQVKVTGQIEKDGSLHVQSISPASGS